MSIEQWDAYTRDGELAGETLIRGENIPAGLFHMVCEVLVRHADGSVLCMKRSESKPNYPGYYEATAGGSALKGEDKLTCVRRELKEETGLDCDTFREIGCTVDEQKQTIYCAYVCTVNCEKNAVTLQDGETEAFVWMTEREFALFLKSDKMIERQRRRYLSYYKEMGWFGYKLLALDMDGTLLNSKGGISEKNRACIQKAMARRVLVTISTGRSIHGARAAAEELGLKAPIIACNGAEIVDPVTGKALFGQELTERDALTVMECGIQKGTTMCIWSKGRLYGLPMDDRVRAYRKFSGIDALSAPDIRVLAREGVTKVLWFDEAERIQALRATLLPDAFEHARFCTSQPMFLEFFHRDVSKAAAMEKIGSLYGIDRTEMIAMGDGANDLEMLSYAGLGVAMGNASDEVKRYADAVAPTNDEDGVADVIEKYLL